MASSHFQGHCRYAKRSRGPYKYRSTVARRSRYDPQRSGTLERSGINVPERLEHAFRNAIQKRSNLSRYIRKTFRHFQVPSKNVRSERSNVPERVPGTFQVRSGTRSKKRSKSVPAFLNAFQKMFQRSTAFQVQSLPFRNGR